MNDSLDVLASGGGVMAEVQGGDRFAIIEIVGLHSHTCERAIQRSLLRYEGIREVEVDFASGQASVLFDPHKIAIETLASAIADAGYAAANITPGRAGCGAAE